MDYAIDIRGLSKRYDSLVAVDELSLRIDRGEIFGLLGPNGAGKTSLLMILSTLVKASSGQAWVNGFEIGSQPGRVRQSIGMVFQDPSSDELLSGYENLKLHAMLYNIPLKEINSRISAVLSLVDLQKRQHDRVKTYSGGMRRRMEIARGLLHHPEILFLDEPTMGLDPQTREHIWEYIAGLSRERNMTIVLTTHYMEEAERLCSRVAIIDHGKIIALDTPEHLRQAVSGDQVLLKGRALHVGELKKLPFVRHMEEKGDLLELSVDQAGKNLQEILRVAGDLDQVEVHKPDLNDVFLYFTGSGIRESEGGALEHIRSLNRVRQNK